MKTDEPNAAPSPKLETVTLQEPLRRGDQVITSIQIRKPKGGEMRGLNLQGIQQADINTMIALIPRITIPPLTAPEVENELDPADLLSIAGTISGFFYTRADKEALARVLGQIDRETPTS